MSVERYYLINQLMDFTILSIAARGMASFNLSRVFAASALSACFALLPASCHAPPLHLGMLLLSAFLIAPSKSIGAYSLSVGAIFHCVALAGILGKAFGEGFGIATLLSAMLGATLAMAHRKACFQNTALRPTSILICNMGRRASFSAIIDTGNRLREPLSGQPVLIVEAARLHELLPGRGFRTVRYASVGNSGAMKCFRPDSIYIVSGKQVRPAPEAWVALYPGKLPRGLTALAPAEYAL